MGNNIQLVIPKIPLSKEDSIRDEEYFFIRDLILNKTGIFLDQNKTAMIQSRLARRFRALNLGGCGEYITYLRNNPEELEEFINALTTNKTEFFRESDHFDYLKNVFLKNLVSKERQKGRTIYIWSAACSTGEEVYTLSFIMKEFVASYPEFDFRILGTDIDTSVIKKASEGFYSTDILKTIPPQYVTGNLVRAQSGDKDGYLVSTEIRNKIKFRYHNLIDSTNVFNLKFDIVFLRNVLIYFPSEVIEKVINKLASYMVHGGLLFIGHSETLNGIKHKLAPLGSSMFEKRK